MNTAFADETTKQILDRNKMKNSIKEEQKMISVGLWKPFDGLKMRDVLFPHVSHGFRGKVFHIITYHVNGKFEVNQKAANQLFAFRIHHGNMSAAMSRESLASRLA